MVDCRRCSFYFVTWRKTFPHGCRAMGFMSLELPSSFVLRVSGEPCLRYEEKSLPRSPSRPTAKRGPRKGGG